MQVRLTRHLLWVVFFCACHLVNERCVSATNQPNPTLANYLKKLGYYSVPLERRKELSPCVPVQIGAGQHRFAVDTGCAVTTVNKALGKKWARLADLGGVLKDSYFGSWTNETLVVMPDLRIGEAWFTNQPAMLEPISRDVQNVSGTVGILGVDFMLRSHCLLDCVGPQLFVRSDALTRTNRVILERTLERSGFRRIELKICPGLGLTCDALLNGHPVTLFLDTGAFWTILDTRVADRYRVNTSVTPMELRGVRKQSARLYAARLTSLQLNGVPISTATKSIGVAHLGAWQITPGKPAENSRAVDGLLGSELLMLCQALIDPVEGCMWLVPDEGKTGRSPPGS